MNKRMFSTMAIAAALLASQGAWATKVHSTRKIASAEAKYCGKWVVGPHGYHTEYDHFKPSTLLGTVKDGKFNAQVFARAEGGSWAVLQDIDRGRCICIKGVLHGHELVRTSGIFECNGGAEILPEDHGDSGDPTEDNT